MGNNPNGMPPVPMLRPADGLTVVAHLRPNDSSNPPAGTLFEASATPGSGNYSAPLGINGAPSGQVRLHFDDAGRFACSMRPHIMQADTLDPASYTLELPFLTETWIIATCTLTGMADASAHLLCHFCAVTWTCF